MKLKYILIILAISVGIAAIMGSYGDASSYVDFAEAADSPDKEFHVVGSLIKEKPMEYDPVKDPNYFAFYMEDESGNERKVIYHNPKPNDFEMSEKVVLVGKVHESDQFVASKILLKCPSKYEEEVENI